MSGYLHFEQTKSAAINKVLRELELAGTSYHDTSQWDESDYLERDDRSHLARIQDAANEAADTIEQLAKERDSLLYEIEWFVNRCNAGQIRSVKTKARFESILAKHSGEEK